MKRFMELSQKILQTDARTLTGNEDLANTFQHLMQLSGLQVQTQQVFHSLEGVSKRQFNLIGILGDSLVDRKIRKGLLLQSHLDVGDWGLPAKWTQTEGKPLAAVEYEGRLYGQGAADAKLDFLCKLTAVQKFREKKLKQPIYLVGTCGEQMGMFGCKYLIQSQALNPKYVLVGKPTGLCLMNGQKSQNRVQVEVGYHTMERGARGFNRKITLHAYGQTSSGAFPAQGSNAILSLLKFLQFSKESGFEIKLTSLQGGNASGQVPDHARAEIFLTSHQHEDFKRFFREVSREAQTAGVFQIELGGPGEAGISFIPGEVFDCLFDILGEVGSVLEPHRAVQNEGYEVPALTSTVSLLRQSASRMDIVFDWRLLPATSAKDVHARFQESLKNLSERYPALNLKSQLERVAPGYEGDAESEILSICGNAMEAADLMPNVGLATLSSEAGHFHEKGYPVVTFGAGEPKNNAQAPNESCSVDDLLGAQRFYERLIEKVCL
jgi:acetylornithine deacetylase/succinyl-diaminopimelate desuccinylase-like protein